MSRSDNGKDNRQGPGKGGRQAEPELLNQHSDLENHPEKTATPKAKIEILRTLIREGLESGPSELLDMEDIKRAARTPMSGAPRNALRIKPC